jgi:hypothetical protein
MTPELIPFWNVKGEEVVSYEDSWHYQVLDELTAFAHGLMSREITDLSGEEKLYTENIQVLIPDVAPEINVVFYYNDDLDTIERVVLVHGKMAGITIEIPPPLYSLWQED